MNSHNFFSTLFHWNEHDFLAFHRVLKTPTEEIWPGVSSLPDYHATFPNWTSYNLKNHVANLDEQGLALLKEMLVYDPAHRISAKRIAQHKYFENLDKSTRPVLTP